MKNKNYSVTAEKNNSLMVIVKDGLNNRYQSMIRVSVDIDYSILKISKWNYCIVRYDGDKIANWTSKPEENISVESLNAGIREIKKNFKIIKNQIANAVNHPAFDDMQNAVNQIVKHYHSDFNYHDRMQLGKEGYYHRPFIWLVRDCGTWFLTKYDHTCREIYDYSVKHDNPTIFYFDGKELTQLVNLNDANRIFPTLANDYLVQM
jgi:hypothetical protein